MMSLRDLEFLQSPAGMEQLHLAAGFDLVASSLVRDLDALRRKLTPSQSAAVLGQAALRRRGRLKFDLAEEMLFTADGLEQASSQAVAAHSAARYAIFDRVADCCCGVGGDLLALARRTHVDAYDIDPVAIACAKHNLVVHGLAERVAFHQIDLETAETPETEAIFFDPSRRENGRRVFSINEYHPSIRLVDRWSARVAAIGIKVAPGVDHDEITWDCEREFVAEGPDLKEGLLWLGPLATVARRATVLPSGISLVSKGAPKPELGQPSAWLYDPSPAITRAGLVAELAALIGAQQLDPKLAYLTGRELVETPLAPAFAIESWLPFGLKRLRAHLRSLDVGRVEVRRRGAPIEPAMLERQLRLEGSQTRLLFLTRMSGRMIAIICRNH
jgi:SAM-dependent methyltransferase